MPENTEKQPTNEIPETVENQSGAGSEAKKKAPRNTSGLKPPLNQLPPDVAFAIRSKGGKAAAKKRREEKLVKDALLNLLTKPQHKKKDGKAHYKASAELASYDDALSENTTLMVQMLIPLIQSAINGNIESLFAILRILGQTPGTPGQFGIAEFVEPSEHGSDGSKKGDGADADNDSDAVRIHLIRGDKPVETASDSNDIAASPIQESVREVNQQATGATQGEVNSEATLNG